MNMIPENSSAEEENNNNDDHTCALNIPMTDATDMQMHPPYEQGMSDEPGAVCEGFFGGGGAAPAPGEAPVYDHSVSDEFLRHVADAYTMSIIRTRTVTPLEFFWNIYSLMKSLITTFLGLPGVSMALSTVGADQITSTPGMEQAFELFENFLKMILLFGSKPGFKVALLDKDGQVTYEVRGVQPPPKTCMTMLFPQGRHICIPFKDLAGNVVFSYDMPKKPMCGKRKGAKVVSGDVKGQLAKHRIDCGEIKVLGGASKPSFCDNIVKLRKVAAKGKTCQMRFPYFFTWSGYPNKGQPFLNPYVEIQPAGMGVALSKSMDSTKMIAQGQAAAAARGVAAPAGPPAAPIAAFGVDGAPAAAGSPPVSPSAKGAAMMSGLMFNAPNFWVQIPFPIIASTVAMMMDVADELGVGDLVEAAANAKDSSAAGAGNNATPKDVEAAAAIAKSALTASSGVRMRNVLTQRCRLHVNGVLLKDFPIEQRLDLIAGMLWLDYSVLQKLIV